MKVLVVDDNETNRLLVSTLLDEAGIEWVEAASGSAALDTLGRESIDVMLLDISMPGMSGAEVCRKIRTSAVLPQPRIVAFTAHAMPQEIIAIMTIGFDGILSKPFSRDQLLNCLAAG